MIRVRMLRAHFNLMKGEVAGFPQAQADDLIARKIAVAHDPAAFAAAKAEADRLTAEEAAKAEAERRAAEEAAKVEADRLAAEEAAKAEADRLAAEDVASKTKQAGKK